MFEYPNGLRDSMALKKYENGDLLGWTQFYIPAVESAVCHEANKGGIHIPLEVAHFAKDTSRLKTHVSLNHVISTTLSQPFDRPVEPGSRQLIGFPRSLLTLHKFLMIVLQFRPNVRIIIR